MLRLPFNLVARSTNVVAATTKINHRSKRTSRKQQQQQPKIAIDTLGVIGAPFGKGQRKPGTELAPQEIRATGFLSDLKEMGWKVNDYGDLISKPIAPSLIDIPNKKLLNLCEVAATSQSVSEAVQDIVSSGQLCVTLGGDHAIAIGTLHGHATAARKNGDDVAVLWIDAHADANTAESTTSGNMHGLPVALNLRELNHPTLPGMDWLKPLISSRRLAYIGLRSVDPFEKRLLKELGITAFDMNDVANLGIDEVSRRALGALSLNSSRKTSLHVSFDIDALDVVEAPSTGTPVRGGLTIEEGLKVVEDAFATGKLAAFDLVEVNPQLGSEKDAQFTLESARMILVSALGANQLTPLGEGEERRATFQQ